MKIKSIRVYHKNYPYSVLGHGRLKAKSISLHDTIVAVESDTGLIGWGEACPLGPTYLPATTQMIRGGLEHLGPMLIGADPLALGVINSMMDNTVRGHEASKSALDIACWDLLGKHANLPVSTLLGGTTDNAARLYDSIPLDTPETMVETIQQKRAQGISVFQVKLGEGAIPDINRIRAIASIVEAHEIMVCDANRGWTLQDARAVVMAADELPPEIQIFVEQPCETYQQSVTIRKICRRPFVQDEVIDNIQDIHQAVADDAMDAVVIKLSHVGGLTKARDMARFAADLGLKIRVEDTVGADIVRSAVAHLAVTIPHKNLLATYPHNAPISLGETDSYSENGHLIAGKTPGLGFTPDVGEIGELIAEYE